MSTTTVTIQVPPQQDQQLRNIPQQVQRQPRVKKSYFAYGKELGGILDCHSQAKDTLSQNLYQLGRNIIQLIRTSQGKPPLDAWKQNIEQLNAHLMNPFAPHTQLVDPWLLNDLVWEKVTLIFFCRCWHAKYGNKPMPFEPIPHLFAKEMLIWIKSIKPEDNALAIAPSRQQITTSHVDAFGRTIIVYSNEKPSNVITELDTDETIDSQSAEEHIQKFGNMVSVVLKTRSLQAINQVLEIVNHNLEVNNKQKAERRIEDYKQLRKDLNQQTEQLKTDVAEVREISDRNNELHIKEEGKLRKDLGETKQELYQTKAQVMAQQITINSLESQVDALNGQVAWMQDEVNNADSGCVIS